MELNANVNTFYKGLDLDSDISILDKSTIRYAENIKLITNKNGTTASLQNADFIQRLSISLPYSQTQTILDVIEAKQCVCDDTICTPKECAVVFTLNSSNNKNYVYTIDFDTLQIREVIRGAFGWNGKLSLVSNFESCDVSNVYIADGVNTLRRINIAKQYGEADDLSELDMVAKATLNSFQFDTFVSGMLKAGKYQYAYQLFSENGGASALSAISRTISVSSTNDLSNSNQIKGSQPNDFTGKAIPLKTSFINNKFDRIRIYRIFYEVTGQAPQIHVADEVIIPQSSTVQTFEYIDYGNDPINIITIDELNQLTIPYDFNAKTIEIKNNRLFAANITENTWDVEYDARAYRADKSGVVVLKSTNSEDVTFNINNIPDIPEDHDCLNPSNLELFDSSCFTYVYNKDGIFGGAGINVSYEFVFTEVILSESFPKDNKIVNDLSLNSTNKHRPEIRTYDIKGNLVQTSNNIQKIVRNYSDAYFCNHYTGYQRDEIYRFGIVLYNDKDVASPVHWIGDIRIPGPQLGSSSSSALYPFHFARDGQYVDIDKCELLGFSIGLMFTVKNLPSDVVNYQIVRCPRDVSNRTIISQVVASSLITSKGENKDSKDNNWLNDKISVGEKGLFPQFMLNMANKMVVANNDGGNFDIDVYEAEKGYLELISPEICVSQEESAQMMNGAKLCHVYNLYSYVGDTNSFSLKEGGKHTGYTLAVTPTKVLGLNGSSTDQTNDFPFSWSCMGDDWYWNQFIFTGSFNSTEGISGLFKYYNVDTANVSRYYSYTIESTIAPPINIIVSELEDVTKSPTPISNMVYVNTSIAGYQQWGWHGKNVVAKVGSDFRYATANNELPVLSNKCMNNAGVFNVKKASNLMTDSHNARTNSVYIGCGNTSNSSSTICYGGDTYLTVLDYLNTSFSQRTNDYNNASYRRIHTQCYIPFETTVNTNLFSNEQYHFNLSGIEQGKNLIQSVPVSYGAYAQTEPLYVYNTIYSQEGTAIKYVPKLMYSKDDMQLHNRIIVSEMKTNTEIQDSWLVFKVANYLDVDNQYGQITNLKNFGDKLYYFQDNAVGIASVNDRSLIIDNINQLTLGTGDILNRFDYIMVTNGSSVINDKSIVTSATSLYWYDFNKNTLCNIGTINDEVSKVKNVQSYYNDNYKLNRKNAISFFDKKYNEIWFKVLDKSLIYNETLGAFTSFNTHDFDHCLTFGDRNITIKNGAFYVHNDLVNEGTTVEPMISKLHIVVNDNFMYTKTFDNVMFYADFKNNINNITSILFSTKTQNTLKIDANDIECREDDYRFAIPRESQGNTGMSYAGRMRGKYLEEFYTFDCTNNKTFKIPYIKTTYRQSRL